MASITPNITVTDRSSFVTQTYAHLLGAILGFAALEVIFFQTGLAFPIASFLLSLPWLVVLFVFIGVSWVADHFAARSVSLEVQYAALIGFVVAEAIIFVPLLFLAQSYAPGVIQSAALVTLIGFSGLTAVAWSERRDFSFLGGLVKWGFASALLVIVAGAIFGFHLGTFFSVAMVVLAGASILYQTSSVLHHYPEDRYVSASLALFASVAMMFWYVLQIFMGRD